MSEFWRWHWQQEASKPFRRQRRRRLTQITLLALALAATGAVTALPPPAQADLHSARSPEELTARYDGTYEEVLDPHPEHGAISTSEISVSDDRVWLWVTVETSTYPSATRAGAAYRLWSPMRSTFDKPWYEPIAKAYPARSVQVAAGTEVRGIHCDHDGSSVCGTWIFWQIEKRSTRKTELVREPVSYEVALAELLWVGQY